MKNKSKKGQFYMLTAVILLALSFIIFALSKNTVAKKEDDSFSQLKDNYIRESSDVINNIVYEKNKFSLDNPNMEKFDVFTNDFIKYSHSKDNSFSLFYLFNYDNELLVGNHLNAENDVNQNNGNESNVILSINNVNYTLANNNFQKINLTGKRFNSTLYAFGSVYKFSNDKDIDLNVLFRSSKNDEVKAIVY